MLFNDVGYNCKTTYLSVRILASEFVWVATSDYMLANVPSRHAGN